MLKKLRSSLLLAPLFLTASCSMGPGDYVIYRVAFDAPQAGADCGEPGPSQVEDSSTFGTPSTVALFAFEDIYYLEFGDNGMGGVAALEGSRDGKNYTFNGTSIDVEEIDPMNGTKTTATYDVEVAAVIKGKNMDGIAVITTSTTCSGESCPDSFPFSCTTQTTFRGSTIDDTDLERPI